MSISTTNMVTVPSLRRRACGMCSWMKKKRKCEPLVRSDGSQICRRCQSKNLLTCPAFADRSKPEETGRMIEGVISHLMSCKPMKATPAYSPHSGLIIRQNEDRDGVQGQANSASFQPAPVRDPAIIYEMPVPQPTYIPSNHPSGTVRHCEQRHFHSSSSSQPNTSSGGIGCAASPLEVTLDIDAYIASVLERHSATPAPPASFDSKFGLPDAFSYPSAYHSDLLPYAEEIGSHSRVHATSGYWQNMRLTHSQATADVYERISPRNGPGNAIEYEVRGIDTTCVAGTYVNLDQTRRGISRPSELANSMSTVNARGDFYGMLTAPPCNQRF